MGTLGGLRVRDPADDPVGAADLWIPMLKSGGGIEPGNPQRGQSDGLGPAVDLCWVGRFSPTTASNVGSGRAGWSDGAPDATSLPVRPNRRFIALRSTPRAK